MNCKIIILFVLFIINTCLKAQTSIDFYPKMLQKELIRTNGKINTLKELTMNQYVTRQIFLGKFYSILNSSTLPRIKYIYIGRVNTCRAGICSTLANQAKNDASEFFDYFILFDSTCTVQQVKIYNYQATHGQEVTAKNWLKQFTGYKGNTELIAGKNIDAISGATISADAASFDIEHKTGLLKQTLVKY